MTVHYNCLIKLLLILPARPRAKALLSAEDTTPPCPFCCDAGLCRPRVVQRSATRYTVWLAPITKYIVAPLISTWLGAPSISNLLLPSAALQT